MEDPEIGKTIETIMSAQEKSERTEPPHERDAPIEFGLIYEGYDFYDNVSGSKLDQQMAVLARRAEMEFFKRRRVVTKVRREK